MRPTYFSPEMDSSRIPFTQKVRGTMEGRGKERACRRPLTAKTAEPLPVGGKDEQLPHKVHGYSTEREPKGDAGDDVAKKVMFTGLRC